MKRRKAIRSWVYLAVMGVAALTMAIIPSPALAQCPETPEDCPDKGTVSCTAGYLSCDMSKTCDADVDGISDYDECVGIYLYGVTTFPGYPGDNSGLPRNQYLDPNSQDLFVILVPAAAGSLIPADPVEFVYRPKTSGGLGIATHVITASQANSDRYFGYRNSARTIQIPQKAARVTESLNTENLIILGIAEYGTPNDLDLATVYTQRIKSHIMNACGSKYGTADCVDSTGVKDYLSGGVWVYDLTNKYIKHTIAHEIGHMLTLTTQNVERFDGHHYKSGSQVILEQAVAYTSKGGKVTFYLSDKYLDPADYTGINLK